MKENNRSEYVSIYVTPELKKEFEAAKDNQVLKETIIKRYLQGESDWLEQELKGIDEATIKYQARLIGIKDSFAKVQDAYVTEIENLYQKVTEADKKISTQLQNAAPLIKHLTEEVKSLSDKIPYINTERIERLITVVEKYNGMTAEEKELIKLILK